jgi:hypothetical protein
MLNITIPKQELYDEENNEFINLPEKTICLEHSLVSVSKWESKWKKPFLSKEPKTVEETIDYIKCMTITQNVDDKSYNYLSKKNIEDINKYIDDSMTATTFYDTRKNTGRQENITSELIYFWMISLNIPMECQKWHLNRLLTLIKICNIKNDSGKKMSRSEINSRNAALNAARRKKLNTRG